MRVWSGQEARAALRVACRSRGLDFSTVEMLQLSRSAVYLLPGGIVAKVSRPEASREALAAGISVAAELAARGFACIRPREDLSRDPIPVGGSFVSFWDFADNLGEEAPAAEAARTALELHGQTVDTRLPRWDPLREIQEHIRTLSLRDIIDEGEAEALWGWHRHLQSSLETETPLGEGLLHGNFYPGNIKRQGKRYLLLDFDAVSWGPREWDLLYPAVYVRRYGHDRDEYIKFSRTYDFDLSGWSGFSTMVLLRELLLTCSRLLLEIPGRGTGEGRRRLSSWMVQGESSVWSGY